MKIICFVFNDIVIRIVYIDFDFRDSMNISNESDRLIEIGFHAFSTVRRYLIENRKEIENRDL